MCSKTVPTKNGYVVITGEDPGPMYLYIDRPGVEDKIVFKSEPLTAGSVVLDYDIDGRLIGIEIY